MTLQSELAALAARCTEDGTCSPDDPLFKWMQKVALNTGAFGSRFGFDQTTPANLALTDVFQLARELAVPADPGDRVLINASWCTQITTAGGDRVVSQLMDTTNVTVQIAGLVTPDDLSYVPGAYTFVRVCPAGETAVKIRLDLRMQSVGGTGVIDPALDPNTFVSLALFNVGQP
jgi:hypothetical protein